jgi:hypothetical protein
MSCADAGRCYQALRLARRVVQHEDAVFGRGRHVDSKQFEHAIAP